ncbi:glycoside hydrolase family 43 protein [Tellurirhabdus rosea]|uniref:glycoside hydrolase family 43 protein n=1 Tax=Tellurirhabdus rosea TaxID=2674997 RepID=UPI00224F8CB0|nr:glycoside hydrolase family 43 protein [Tellurirhabdus rosea]
MKRVESGLKRTFLINLLICVIPVLTACRDRKSDTPTPPVPSANTFLNPLLNSGPDPWVVRHDGWYYYCHTVGNGVRLWKTRRISELAAAENRLVWQPAAGEAFSRNVWAPELHRLDGKWYLYVTAGSGDNSTQRLWVLENGSDDPLQGTWTMKGQLTPPENRWAIDATVGEVAGQRYVVWSGWEGTTNVRQDLYIARLANPWTIDGPRVRIALPEYEWEKVGDPDVNEGPEFLQKGGKTFLIYSASGCWTDDYALGMLSLRAGADPMDARSWQKAAQPVFSKAPESRAFGPGHGGFFSSPDGTEDWMIYHANPMPGQGCNDTRSPRIQKISWTTDGVPQFGRPAPVLERLARPGGE